MQRRGRIRFAYGFLCAGLWSLVGCASMRRDAPTADLRPCTDAFAYTEDGWRLGIRHYRPEHPDPGKLPVVLCHGLGLNATFWTITDDHLPSQLAARGYDVFVFDIRGSGENARVGRDDRVNHFMRQTCFRELDESLWTVDDLVRLTMTSRPFSISSAAKPGTTASTRVGQQLGRNRSSSRTLEASAESRANCQFRRDGEHDHPGRNTSVRYARSQPWSATDLSRR